MKFLLMGRSMEGLPILGKPVLELFARPVPFRQNILELP
jgi:hypothetical protein